MPLKSVDSSFTRTQFVEEAIFHTKDLFIKEMGDSCVNSNELVGVKTEFRNKSSIYNIDVFKVRESRLLRFLGVKNTVSRKVLRVIDILGPNRFITIEDNPSVGRIVRERPGCFFPPVTGKEPLKCELFLDHPGLLDIAQRVLEPLAKQLKYTRVEYINASKHKSAWYPGEPRPEFPKARLVER